MATADSVPARRREPPLATGSKEAAPGRVRAFILLRFTLIIAASYLLLEQTGFRAVPGIIFALIGFGLLSNLVVYKLPPTWIESAWFTAGVVVVDTIWITGALLITGRFEPEFFYLYFFVLFVAAIGENLRLIALGAVVICGGYLYGLVEAHGTAALANSASLIRIPFLFAVATFYGYLVDRVRSEQRRAEKEAATVVELEGTQVALAQHAREVEEARDELEHEVAERRRMEEELRKLTRAVEQSPSMVAITDTEGVLEYANPRFAKAVGLEPEEAVGRLIGKLESGEGEGEDAWQALRSRGEWEGEVMVTPAGGGEEFWAATSISHLVDERGGTDHCIVVQQDISDRKRAEETLRQANEELTKLSEMKSDFVSIVSHELRTPLTAIKNSIDLLQKGADLDGEARERFFSIAARNVDRLRLIIDDLLDLSKLEAGKLEFRFRRV
ncbi:MAG TPA: histidine kinase dimerization/phospho-acceptor domain-containing protein, partial [Thermoanaerobaculia bacterium]|nr:histidine kinase dimerization/phospho-acceptor domain-containing protein [Thermoanaerobaculia bacterium]